MNQIAACRTELAKAGTVQLTRAAIMLDATQNKSGEDRLILSLINTELDQRVSRKANRV